MENMALIYRPRRRLNPHKFALWLAMASIIMMFTAFTSAYIVRQAAGNWLDFSVPNVFYGSTVAILLCSLSLHLSLRSFKKGNKSGHRSGMVIGFALGILFVVLQYIGWQALFSNGIDLKGNPSGSFFYVITGVHALHVLGGIAVLIVALVHAFSLKFKPSIKRINRYELVVQYWHFVDILWVYLFIFLLVTR